VRSIVAGDARGTVSRSVLLVAVAFTLEAN
jgi:hypothetical protein